MDNFAPLISIIVPIYKVEQYLPRCVDSLINQTYQNLEIILPTIIDDEKDTFIIEEGTGPVCIIYTVDTPVASYDYTCSAQFTVVEGEQ